MADTDVQKAPEQTTEIAPAEGAAPRKRGKGAPKGGIGNIIGEMPASRRIMVLAMAALAAAGLIAAFLWINQPTYQTLYSGLTQKDASQVVTHLQDQKIPYELAGDGTTIKVPEENLYEARLSLASVGLPRGSAGVGFEVFNEIQMGTTDFVQRINFQRALQGELARTISSFTEIEDARVHIVLPRESLFVEEEKKPSAAVVVRLVRGKALTPNQIAGIVNLVSSSVPDLTDDRVTIVDTRGNLIYRKETDKDGFPAALTASQLDYQKNIERGLSAKVQSMLEQVLGPGRAVVRVNADIDFTRTATTQDLYDPDQVVVRSETRASDKSTNSMNNMPMGSPDQRYTLAEANANPEEAQGQSKNNTENETTNYEISRTQKQIVQAIGGLDRITVAVMVDGPYKETADPEGKVTREFAPRSAEEMQQLTQLVRQAVGFDDKRGDQVTLANIPFHLPSDLGDFAAKTWEDYVKEWSRPALNIVLALLFFLLVVRPALKIASNYVSAKGELAAATRRVGPAEELTGEEAPAALAEAAMARKVSVRDQILLAAQQDPERATAALRGWIHEAA